MSVETALSLRQKDSKRLDWWEKAHPDDRPVQVTAPDKEYESKKGWWNIGIKVRGEYLFPTLRAAIDVLMEMETEL